MVAVVSSRADCESLLKEELVEVRLECECFRGGFGEGGRLWTSFTESPPHLILMLTMLAVLKLTLSQSFHSSTLRAKAVKREASSARESVYFDMAHLTQTHLFAEDQ